MHPSQEMYRILLGATKLLWEGYTQPIEHPQSTQSIGQREAEVELDERMFQSIPKSKGPTHLLESPHSLRPQATNHPCCQMIQYMGLEQYTLPTYPDGSKRPFSFASRT